MEGSISSPAEQQAPGKQAEEIWGGDWKGAVMSHKEVDLGFWNQWEGSSQGNACQCWGCFPAWRVLSFAHISWGLLAPSVCWKQWVSLYGYGQFPLDRGVKISLAVAVHWPCWFVSVTTSPFDGFSSISVFRSSPSPLPPLFSCLVLSFTHQTQFFCDNWRGNTTQYLNYVYSFLQLCHV